MTSTYANRRTFIQASVGATAALAFSGKMNTASAAKHTMAAIGKPGSIDTLPPDLQTREHPSERNPVSSFIFEGIFTNST